jgi:hypothetical protein
MRWARWVILAAFTMFGCVTGLNAERLANTEKTILSAEAAGAAVFPEARVHLQLAKDQTAAARRLAAEGDDRANQVLSRAEADAELAFGLARESSVHGVALKAAAGLRAKDGVEAVAPPAASSF